MNAVCNGEPVWGAQDQGLSIATQFEIGVIPSLLFVVVSPNDRVAIRFNDRSVPSVKWNPPPLGVVQPV